MEKKVTAEGVWCPSCKTRKPLTEFHISNTRSCGVASYCKQCEHVRRVAQYAANPEPDKRAASAWNKAHRDHINARRKERRDNNPEWAEQERVRDRERHPDRWIKDNYKLTREQWNAILEAQGGGCGCCGSAEPGGNGRFHVDHDHSCCPGKKSCGECVRGLLCNYCNHMLGNARDSEDRLHAGIEYLRRHRLKIVEALSDDSAIEGGADRRVA